LNDPDDGRDRSTFPEGELRAVNRVRGATLILMQVIVLAWAGPGSALAQGPATDRVAELEARLQRMEAVNRELAGQLDRLRDEVASLRPRADDEVEAAQAATPTATPPGLSPPTSALRERAPNVPAYVTSGTREKKKRPLKAYFGPGFELLSEDEEFLLQIHQETQLDYREFDPNGEEFARSGFVFPRVRLLFNGRVGKPYEYMVSINRGFGNLDILDAFVNFHSDDRFQIKLGRFQTPFNYEQFAVQNMWLIAPERSLFTANLGLNRQLGAMIWGTVFDERLDYAFGVFDGPRNSYEDFNDAKDVMSYLNVRPFQARDDDFWLKNLNFGGSFVYGNENGQDTMVPRSFRVASNASNAGTADRYAPPFLIFGPAVEERGDRSFWSGHLAYFRNSLSIIADYNGGILSLVKNPSAAKSVDLPVNGYSIAAGYFLTGEKVTRRTILEPKRPFKLGGPGAFQPGAVELIARYSTFDIDPAVFSAGLADPSLWSHSAWTTNLGINWYLNRYIKFYLNWQHAEFGSPVFYAPPDRRQITNQMLWLRCQIYF
jgi:phosphate-selective porin OprO/OprP